jgi:hypothetical protein
MTIYKLKTEDGVVYVSANLVEASAPIHTYFGSDPRYDEDGGKTDLDGLSWQPTPYQTADCQHYEDRMAKLVAEYCDMGDVLAIEATK